MMMIIQETPAADFHPPFCRFLGLHEALSKVFWRTKAKGGSFQR
jgi:hypothetical protein